MRKKILFTAFLCIALFSTASAQYFFAERRFKYGFTVGMERSTISANYTDDLGWVSGFKLALIGDYAVTKNFSLVPEFAFVQRGVYQKWGVDVDNYSYYDYSDKINYLQLPVNAMLKLRIGENSKILLFAGPYFSYPFSGTQRYKERWNSGNVHEPVFALEFGSGKKATYNQNIECGLNLGVGYDYADFFVKVQYNAGLTNMLNPNYYTETENGVILKYEPGDYLKNKNIGISIGYYFFR